MAGSHGLFSSGVPSDFGVRLGESGLLQGVRQTSDFRDNVFLVETGRDTITAELALLDANGNVLGAKGVTLQPREPTRLNIRSIANTRGCAAAQTRRTTAPSHGDPARRRRTTRAADCVSFGGVVDAYRNP